MSTFYKRLSFTNEEEESLIEFIKHHPALWDAKHNEYSNGELRKIYWRTIAAELNKSVLECRRKWRFIRDYYIHKRRRLNDSTPERDGKYFSLHFLDNISIRKFANSDSLLKNTKAASQKDEQIRKTKRVFEDSEAEFKCTSDDVTFEKVTMERIDQSDDYMLDDDEGITSQDQEGNDESTTEGLTNEDFNFDDTTIVHTFPNVQKFEEHEEEHLIETRSEPEADVSRQLTDDLMRERAIDLFFESMAAAVKMFPPHIASEAKLRVFTAINELEMRVHSSEK